MQMTLDYPLTTGADMSHSPHKPYEVQSYTERGTHPATNEYRL